MKPYLVGLLAAWVMAAASEAMGKVEVVSVKDGQELRYPLVLVAGTFDGKRLLVEAVTTGVQTSATTEGTRFRVLADLKSGTNLLKISDADGTRELTLTYKPATSEEYRLKAWYVVCKGEDPASPEFNTHITPLYKQKISVQIKLMQSWSAEDMNRNGFGRRTFYPLYDADGQADVGLITLPMTREEVLASPRGIYEIVEQEIPAAFRRPTLKHLAFTSVKAAAQSSGNFCLVGSKTIMQIGPSHVRDLMDALECPIAVDHLQYRAYVGVTLHETGHMMHMAWHPGGHNNVIQSAYGNISRVFTFRDTPAAAPHEDKDLSSWGVHRPLMNWNRWFMSPDPATYKDGKVSVTFAGGQIHVSAEHDLAVVYYYMPGGEPTLYKTLDEKHVKTFTMAIDQAGKELNGQKEWFNVMAVDVEGNMAYATCRMKEAGASGK
ncbi:MAG: hypothetical protein NTV86_11100 [Planctomycetota bacterium]|nr:hypothetical protein [Planctomycetota bacterium]